MCIDYHTCQVAHLDLVCANFSVCVIVWYFRKQEGHSYHQSTANENCVPFLFPIMPMTCCNISSLIYWVTALLEAAKKANFGDILNKISSGFSSSRYVSFGYFSYLWELIISLIPIFSSSRCVFYFYLFFPFL
jgi:hypothetical protein